MTFIIILKKLENAWKYGFITPTEYHNLLNLFLGRLAADEREGHFGS